MYFTTNLADDDCCWGMTATDWLVYVVYLHIWAYIWIL